MTFLIIGTVSFLTGLAVEWAASRHAVRKRQAQADELRFLLAPVIQHSVEDDARRMGC
ncbi:MULTISPECIES: hypothetical protein [unclassified Mesorhizobium]|uniref:hypothetical protein n=1 Tax=unclassified Mesorhizobium TaxID=325217 RepID=UPI0015E42E7F|nr:MULTISPECIES: hypothetical protein [unclassified Mesorhizobium]